MTSVGLDETTGEDHPASGGFAGVQEVLAMSAVRRVLVILSLSLILAAVGAPTARTLAADPDPLGECPETMPLGQVETGQTGFGWTVVRGTEPRPFAVEVLGVFPDGVGPGQDVILVRVSDVDGRSFIANARGIWAGMSGSPVAIDGRLVGAVAYGFSEGPSTLGGLTPIADMLAVGERDEDITVGALSPRLRRALRSASPASAQPSRFGRLALPMTLPRAPSTAPRGGSKQARKALKARYDLAARLSERGLEALPIGNPARRGVAALADERPVPGGNFAASLSYGDLDIVAMGTTTWVCGDRALAFGHPVLHTGRTNLGMHLADALDIVDDPTFSPYKLAVPGPIIGRVGQDRAAGVSGRLDRTPQILEVTSLTRQRADGRERQGRSQIAARTPRMLQWELPAYHAGNNVLSVADAYEDGSVGIGLRVTGTRADGTPFTVRFGDRWIGRAQPGGGAVTTDSATAALYGVGTFLMWLVESPFERVTLDAVDMDLDLGPTASWLLVGVTVARNDEPPRSPRSLCVAPGDQLTVRARLASSEDGQVVSRRLDLTVPRGFRMLRVGGGVGFSPWFDPTRYGSFEAMLDGLEERGRSDELLARISVDGSTRAEARHQLQRVTRGVVRIPLKRVGSASCR